MDEVRWAIVGPGKIAESFAAGLRSSRRGRLQAVGSSDRARAQAFAERFGATVAGTHDEVLGRDDVDAVYIATVHPAHAGLAVRALEAGHAVLCEKPLTPTAAETERVLAAAETAGRPLVEAYKNRFSPFAGALDEVIASGGIGAVRRLDASFGFRAGTREGRLFDPALAGGAILDVGCYPVSFAVATAAAAGIDPAALSVVAATGEIGPTGVDEHAEAMLAAEGFEARIATSLRADLSRSARIEGERGVIDMADAWGSRAASAESFTLRTAGRNEERRVPVVHPFAAEADAVAEAMAAGAGESPRLPWAYSRAIARLLDEWAQVLRAR